MPTDPSKHRRHRERQHDEWRLVVLFLAYTGVRFGEMAALRVRRIDLLRRRAMIAESVTLVRSEQIWGTPKGHERREVSPMSCEITRCPRQDSNLRHRLRRAVLYPLSYGGSSVPRVSADAVHYCPTREWFGPIPTARASAREGARRRRRPDD